MVKSRGGRTTMSKEMLKTSKNGQFDIAEFNADWETSAQDNKKANLSKDAQKLAALDASANSARNPLYNQSVMGLLIGIKNCWFGIIDDVLAKKFTHILTKQNRLFFLGLTIIIITVMIYLYNFFLDDDSSAECGGKSSVGEKIIEKHYVYTQNVPPNVGVI